MNFWMLFLRLAPMRWRWIAWTVFLVLWTVALQVPQPIQADSSMKSGLKVVSKSVHVLAFSVLTLLSGWLQLKGNKRWLMLGFLLVYACLMEYLQAKLGLGRTGSTWDVALNLVGIGVGLLVGWKWWRVFSFF